MAKIKQKIIPHLWYDKEAKEAASFYTYLFPDSRITDVTIIRNTPSGDCDIVSFEISGQKFQAISAGPYFKFNPSISLIVNFDPSKNSNARKSIDTVWEKLSDGGKVVMPIDRYPFSERYGSVQDKYGLSWQLILSNPDGDERPFIVPSLTFTGDASGKAEEAINFYLTVFKDTKKGITALYPEGMEPDKKGAVMFADFMIENYWFAALDSARMQDSRFNEAVSFIILCETQDEIDQYWKKLSAVPEAEQCGWIKDKFGLSWQIVPVDLDEMLKNGTPEQAARLTQAFLQMKKIDIAKLKETYI